MVDYPVASCKTVADSGLSTHLQNKLNWLITKKNSHGFGAMRTEHQGLLYICSF